MRQAYDYWQDQPDKATKKAPPTRAADVFRSPSTSPLARGGDPAVCYSLPPPVTVPSVCRVSYSFEQERKNPQARHDSRGALPRRPPRDELSSLAGRPPVAEKRPMGLRLCGVRGRTLVGSSRPLGDGHRPAQRASDGKVLPCYSVVGSPRGRGLDRRCSK